MFTLSNILRLVTIVTILILSTGVNIPYNQQIIFFVLSVGIIGIPHGATDHLIAAVQHTGRQKWELRKFLFSISSLMIVYTVIWMIQPLTGLVIFLFLSYYHFGQSELYYMEGEKNLVIKNTLYISWGMALINSLLSFHYRESYAIIGPILESYNISALTFLALVKWSAIVSLIYYTIGSFLFLRHTNIKIFLKKLLNLGTLVGLFMTSDLLIGFTIYFAFWHSLKSMTFEISAVNKKGLQLNMRSLLKKAIPLSLLSYLGIALLLYINYTFSFSLPPLTIFFISLSILTLPHVFTMDKLYQGTMA